MRRQAGALFGWVFMGRRDEPGDDDQICWVPLQQLDKLMRCHAVCEVSRHTLRPCGRRRPPTHFRVGGLVEKPMQSGHSKRLIEPLDKAANNTANVRSWREERVLGHSSGSERAQRERTPRSLRTACGQT